MHARKQYLDDVRKEYRRADREQRGKLLDEAERRTRLHRKYLIRILSQEKEEKARKKKLRHRIRKYGVGVLSVLLKVWEIFDYACGQRLASALKQELQRLRRLREVRCSDEIAGQLEEISAKTIDSTIGT